MAAPARLNHRTGSISFSFVLTSPGTLSWLLTFPNGSFGAIQSTTQKCPKNERVLHRRCRSRLATFATGTLAVAKAGAAAITARPGALATDALRIASRRHRGLQVAATITFAPVGSRRGSSKSLKVLDRVTLAPSHTHG